MKPQLVAGFGPIVRDVDASRQFWGEAVGLSLGQIAPDYWGTDGLTYTPWMHPTVLE